MLHIENDWGTYDWHIGEPLPINPFYVNNINEVQADGDELTYILQHCHNIPYHDGVSVKWFGDLARLIAEFLTQHLGTKSKVP
jgi:hypothetical protein